MAIHRLVEKMSISRRWYKKSQGIKNKRHDATNLYTQSHGNPPQSVSRYLKSGTKVIGFRLCGRLKVQRVLHHALDYWVGGRNLWQTNPTPPEWIETTRGKWEHVSHVLWMNRLPFFFCTYLLTVTFWVESSSPLAWRWNGNGSRGLRLFPVELGLKPALDRLKLPFRPELMRQCVVYVCVFEKEGRAAGSRYTR